MGKQLNIFSTPYTPDPITGSIKAAEKHLYDIEKVVKSKDDVKPLNDILSAHSKNWGINKITGKTRTSTPDGFKVSAPMESGYARGHNIRDPNYVEDKKHIDSEGHHETFIDMGPIEKCYNTIFSEPLEEYNNKQTRKDRRIDDYLTHILQDKRRGSMKKDSSVDNSRKANYGFIFEIGNRDHQVDHELTIEVLKKFALEWMPEHYPNLMPICVSLHDDEYTLHPVTNERINSNPHIHWDYIPIAHRLTDEEKEDFENWKNELKENEKAECKAKGIKFSNEEFKNRDWEFERAKRYGKAEINSLSLQSSLSGACAEMGFRTQGINTAQIQMERAVREDFLDFVESYGIPVDRTVEENPEKKVRIDVYKAREDSKAVMKECKEILKEAKNETARNQKKETALEKREKNVEKLETEKKALTKRESEVKKREDKIAPYVERIDTLVQDETSVKVREKAVDKKDKALEKRNTDLDEREKSLDKRKNGLDKFEESLNERDSELDTRETVIVTRENAVTERENAAKAVEIQNKADAEINSENQKKNERNATEIEHRFQSFDYLQERYIKYTCTVDVNEKISLDTKSIGTQLKTELSEPGSYTWRDKVDNAVKNFEERCHKVAVKFQNAIKGFKNFLQGKTSQDFRKLADDMDKNNARTFEEYEQKWNNQELNWQVEERKNKLALKPLKKSYEIERD